MPKAHAPREITADTQLTAQAPRGAAVAVGCLSLPGTPTHQKKSEYSFPQCFLGLGDRDFLRVQGSVFTVLGTENYNNNEHSPPPGLVEGAVEAVERNIILKP